MCLSLSLFYHTFQCTFTCISHVSLSRAIVFMPLFICHCLFGESRGLAIPCCCYLFHNRLTINKIFLLLLCHTIYHLCRFTTIMSKHVVLRYAGRSFATHCYIYSTSLYTHTRVHARTQTHTPTNKTTTQIIYKLEQILYSQETPIDVHQV